jgi:hypothetical protein
LGIPCRGEAGMKCAVTTEDLQAFVDGELRGGARASVAQHLADCPGCREKAAALRDLGRELGALGQPAAPEGLVDQVMATIVSFGGVRRRRAASVLTWRAVADYAASAALAVAVLMFTVDRFEARETGRSMVSTLAADVSKQRETKGIIKALVRAFDTEHPLCRERRPGFDAIVYDARVARDGDVYMLANFSFAGGTCPDIRDEYGNQFVPISLGDWKGPNELVWLTPLKPRELTERPREMTLAFAGRDITCLRRDPRRRALTFDSLVVGLRDPKRGLDPGTMLARVMANAGLDAATQREMARQLRIIAPNGMDALKEPF